MNSQMIMSKYSNSEALKGLTLGKKVDYSHQYDASLLQPVPRALNRDDLQLEGEMPFIGCDIWTMYELSWLNNNGLPQVAIGVASIAFDTPNLIESKSFKLYLNSFNQSQFESWDEVESVIQKDLSACAGGNVEVHLQDLESFTQQPIVTMAGECIDHQDIKITTYEFDATLLENATSDEEVNESLHSHLLKSNCLITNQPDWGSVQIDYQGKKIDREALLRYIVSFREHNEFHEQCVERIFTDIMKYCQPSSLTVYARYTRRGGLDINPYRSNQSATPGNTLRMARQ